MSELVKGAPSLAWREELSPQNRALLTAVERMSTAQGTDDMSWISVFAAKPFEWINLVEQMRRLLDRVSNGSA